MNQVLDNEWQQHLVSSVAHWAEMARESIREAACENARPSAVFKPRLSIDGNQWCALYGENLQEGVAGFGASPEDAMWDFDRMWRAKLPAERVENKQAVDALREMGFPDFPSLKR